MTLTARRAYQDAEREALNELDPELAAQLDVEFRCQGCGCSDSLACEEGCSWASAVLCSACANDGVVVIAVDSDMGRWLTAALAEVGDENLRAAWQPALAAIGATNEPSGHAAST